MIPALTASDVLATVPIATRRTADEFVAEMHGVFAIHLTVIAPAYQAADQSPDRLFALHKAGRAFAKAVREIDPDTESRLEQMFVVFERKQGGLPDTAVKNAGLAIQQMRTAGQHAYNVAAAALRVRQGLSRPRKAAELNSLITEIARAYGAIFGERATPTNSFARLLHLVFQAANIPTRPGIERLKRVLGAETLPGRSPSAGRKRRLLDR